MQYLKTVPPAIRNNVEYFILKGDVSNNVISQIYEEHGTNYNKEFFIETIQGILQQENKAVVIAKRGTNPRESPPIMYYTACEESINDKNWKIGDPNIHEIDNFY